MQVQIKGQTVDLRVSTVTLQPQEGNNLYSFHCPNCGKYNQNIQGRVAKVYPYYEPSDQVPVISTCPRCGHKHTFQTHDGYVSSRVRIILHPTEEENAFYCVYAKHRILEYNKHGEVRTVADGKKRFLPFVAYCPGGKDQATGESIPCQSSYFVAEIIL